MKIARFRISQDFLHRALALPENAVIVDILKSPDARFADFEMRVVSDELPDVLVGAAIILIDPTITEASKPCGCREKTWQWNIEK